MNRLGIAFAAAALAAGCNTSSEGALGNVEFTPQECGRASIGGCDFERPVGVGGALFVQIRGEEGVSTAGATLESGDPEVLAVEPAEEDRGGKPAWRLEGVAPGTARVYAVSSSGGDLDYLDVEVVWPTQLRFDEFLGNAVGPGTADGHDEAWTVNANEDTSFYVTPLADDDAHVLGTYDYDVSLDAGLDDGLIDDAPENGYLHFNVPAGDYAVTYTSALDDQLFIDVLITAE